MKHFLALPALLRASILLASASQHAFSVHDDLLAFPQYEVKFSEEYLDEQQAHAIFNNPTPSSDDDDTSPQQLEQYRPQLTPPSIPPKKEEPKLAHEYMILNSHRYVCSIPIIAPPSHLANDTPTTTAADEAKELARATDRGWELLSAMQGNCVYFISGWWSYRFCYGQGVKQFHQLPPTRGMPVYPPVEDTTVVGFELGNYRGEKKGVEAGESAARGDGEWDGESGVDVTGVTEKEKPRSHGQGQLVQRGESRYLVQHLSGGTKCDLTGKPRKVEIQFHCNPLTSDRITLIKETSTCAYLMVIQTPRLCNDVAFLPPQKDQPNTMSCAPVVAEDEVEAYERETKAAHAAADKEAEGEVHIHFDPATPAPTRSPTGRVVGDIVIGAHTLFPAGRTLTKGAIVGGGPAQGKEVYVDTVASSEGVSLSKEQLEKLGLGDAKAVEKLRKELEGIAGGAKWKLEVVEMEGGGREYRGIIGEDEDEEVGGGDGDVKVTGNSKTAQDGKGKGSGSGKKGDGKVKTKKAKKETKEQIVEKAGGEEEEGSQEEFFQRDEL